MPEGLVSIVLPVYNQAAHIGGTVRQYHAELARLERRYELLLVVNGSQYDDSLAVCQSLADECPWVRVLESTRGGWGRAVQCGLAEGRGDVLCYTNAARTTGSDLLLMLLYAKAFPEVVIKANRRIRFGWRRRGGSLLYNLECRALFDLPTWDINGTPKVFPRRFDRLLHLTRTDDLIDAEFVVTCRRQGYPMLEVPILSSRRHGGRSTTGYGSAVRLYWGAYQLWRTLPA